MAYYLTLARENQFEFTCPIFNANTKMAACMMLREAVWMGKHVEKRQGCQAAMNCSMCPAAAIVKKISYGGSTASDDYGSKEPKFGKIHADILERIKNVIPIERELGRFSLSDNERVMLRSTRERIEAQLRTAPRSNAHVEPRKNTSTVRVLNEASGPRERTLAKPKNDTINRAAMTGDMSAAINAAA